MGEHIIKLPDVGEGVAEAELVEWHVKVGDLVREDTVLAAVMTDKATVEIPSPRAGKVVQRMFTEGQVCPVGKVLIAIDVDEAEESVAAAGAKSAPAAAPAAAAVAPQASRANGVNAPDAGSTRKALARCLSPATPGPPLLDTT